MLRPSKPITKWPYRRDVVPSVMDVFRLSIVPLQMRGPPTPIRSDHLVAHRAWFIQGIANEAHLRISISAKGTYRQNSRRISGLLARWSARIRG